MPIAMTTEGSSWNFVSRLWRSPGIRAPHILVKRSICATLVIGMMPGTMGTVIPAARARST